MKQPPIKLTEEEQELIETIRTLKKLKDLRFLDLELYVRELFERILISDN